jgi:hypothetical protein
MDSLGQKSPDEQKHMAAEIIKKLGSNEKTDLEDGLKSIASVVLIHITLKGEGLEKADEKFIKKATALIPFVAALSSASDQEIKAVEKYATLDKANEKDDDQSKDLIRGIKNLSEYAETIKKLSSKKTEPKKTDGK